MHKKIKFTLFLMFLFFVFVSSAQSKYEREHRIRKSQFPEKALDYISEKMEGQRRIRFYKETDSAKTSYKAKFKKDRLWYSTDFTKEGILENIAIAIKPLDIPEDSFSKIEMYLANYFSEYRIRKLEQQYPIMASEPAENTIKNAFQNLMIADMVYELFVKGKKDGSRTDFEITFDSKGDFIHVKIALPPNYDRILY